MSGGGGRGDDVPFGVNQILVTELPMSIGTVDAPERYDVAAVFTRRPRPEELTLLGGAAVRERLDEAGYPTVTLSAADRRLLIGNTNLHELRAGLARLIGGMLAEIGASVTQTRSAQALDAAEMAERAAERAHAVAAEAEGIDFTPAASASAEFAPPAATPTPSNYR